MFLLVARVFLGGVTAAAAPTVASLTGDFFPAAERAKIYGLILGGELIGFAFGFFVSGEVSSLSTWRWPFFAMSVPSAALIWAIWRYIPEPARGGQSWIKPGETHIRSQEEVDTSPGAGQSGDHSKVEHGAATAQSKARRSGVKPRKELVLKEDPAGKSLWWAIRYMLHIPTYVLLIIASSLGYYFFAGVRAFGMIYITGHYGVSRGVASALVIVISAGALVGLVLGGHLPRWLMKRGWLDARVVVPGVGLFLSALFFAPAIWISSVVLGTLLLTVATFFLAAANPSFDAARLDIIHPSLWGRAESGRMALRAVLEGSAPLLFGALSTWLGGDKGLMWTFLIMLVPLFAASSLAIPARRTYLRDVETAAESAKQTFRSRSDK
jgi:Na+/melibiose symporter-like transporter